MRGLQMNWLLVRASSLAALLFVTACVTGDCDAVDPQPPGLGPDGATVNTGSTYMQVKASTYGPSGGGLFLQVDVGEPSGGSMYTNEADITVWAGSGDDTTGEAPASVPPFEERTLQSPDRFSLSNTRHWGGGTVLDLASGDTKAWVFVRVRLYRNDAIPYDDKIYSYTFGTSPILDLPSGWQDADDLN